MATTRSERGTRPALGHAAKVVTGSWLGEELSVGLALHRYEALGRLRESKHSADWFGARMLGRPALVVRGADGVRTFYDSELVSRRGAVPAPVRLTLFGPRAVHGLDGEDHARRKHLIMRVVDADSVARLTERVGRRLDEVSVEWTSRESLPLFDALVDVYGSAVLGWAGADAADDAAVSRELARMVDGFGVGGTPYPRAALARVRAQRWALGVIRDVRAGRRPVADGTAVAILAGAPQEELTDLAAATELLNIVRPTVAVAYFGAYAAQALARRPDWREGLAGGSPERLRAFELEIRRWYPFAPLLTGRLRRPYRWQGRTFPAGAWIVLDILGTNRDPASWERPEEFLPERFLSREPTEYDYVPHGGGHPAAGHRCPGEPMAQGIVQTTLRRLAALDFEVSGASSEVPLGRIPSLPDDRLTLRNVRRRPAAG